MKRILAKGLIAGLVLFWWVGRPEIKVSLPEVMAVGEPSLQGPTPKPPGEISGNPGPASPDVGLPTTQGATRTTPKQIVERAPTSDTGEVPHSIWPLTRDGIGGAFDEARPLLKECYEGWLSEAPDLQGSLVLGLVVEDVEGEGRVSQVQVQEDQVGHDVFNACVQNVLAELEFDAPEGQMNITYPVEFAQR